MMTAEEWLREQINLAARYRQSLASPTKSVGEFKAVPGTRMLETTMPAAPEDWLTADVREAFAKIDTEQFIADASDAQAIADEVLASQEKREQLEQRIRLERAIAAGKRRVS